ncbi:phage shock protein PspC (stress-responsive transcriptional regulator) [Rathayibacter agropyri]
MTAESTTPPDGGSTETGGAREEPTGVREGTVSGGSTPSGAASEGPSSTGPASGGPTSEAPTSAGTSPPIPENRFVLWLRGLDLPRRPGWIGGVCAGIADRLGIDPLIVRGIVIVVAVLGGPALLFYAAAWLLLPDQDGALPVERLLRGSFDRIHAAIGALVLASMLPMAQGFWSLGGAYTGAIPWSPMTGRTLWSSGVLALIVAFVIWIVRRSGRSSAPPPATVAAQPTEPLAPQDARPSSPEALAEWRERQAAWRAEREAFRAQQSVSAHETARARAEEAHRAAAAITAARLERRRLRRAANPRLRASLTLLAIGAAALTGALVSLTASGPTATVVGFATAALVLGAVIVLAALLKRRAVMLIAFSVVALLTATSSALLPTDRTLLPVLGGTYTFSNGTPGRYSTLLASDLHVRVVPGFERNGELDLWIGVGVVTVEAMQGTAVRIETTSEDTALRVIDPDSGKTEAPRKVSTLDGRTMWTQTFGDPTATPFVVRITQESGSINVYGSTRASAPDGGSDATPAPDATPASDTTTGAAR